MLIEWLVLLSCTKCSCSVSQHWLPEVTASGVGLVATPQPHIQDNCSKEPALKFCHLPPVTLTPQPGHAVMTDRSTHCTVFVNCYDHHHQQQQHSVSLVVSESDRHLSIVSRHHQYSIINYHINIIILSGRQLYWTKQIWCSIYVHVCMCVHPKTDEKLTKLGINMCYGEP